MMQTPRRRQYAGGNLKAPSEDIVILPHIRKGVPLVDGKGGPASSRSSSKASVNLPSILESRCTTISPSTQYSRCTSISPGLLTSKRSSPGLSSVKEEEFEVKLEDKVRLQAVCSRAETTYGLAKLVDPIVWAHEAAAVDRAAMKAKHLPNVQVSILAFDALSRIAKLLPAQRSVLESLLSQLQYSIFVCKGVSKSLRRAEILGRTHTPVLQIDEHSDSSSSDSSGESSGEEIELLAHAQEIAKMYRVTVIPSTVQAAAVSSQNPTRITMRRPLVCFSDRALFDSLPAEPPDRLRPSLVPDYSNPCRPFVMTHRPQFAEGKHPVWFTGHPPYFALARTHDALINQAMYKVSWMKEVCDGLEGQGNAAENLLILASELTSGKLLTWCFACWKMQASAVSILDYQITGLKAAAKDVVKMAFCGWLFFTQRSRETRQKRELQDRTVEMEVMTVDLAHCQHVQGTIASDMEINDGQGQRLAVKHGMVRGKRAKLEEELKNMRPEVLRPIVRQTLENLLGYAVDICKLQWVHCKRRFFSKDLALLFMEAESGSLNVLGWPCEALLVRWINYLLTVVKRQAAELLDLGVKDAVSEAKDQWSTKDLQRFTSRCRQVRGAYLIENLGEDLSNGLVLSAIYAVLTAFRRNQSHFDPANLWPMDERTKEGKSAALCQCLVSLAPTTAARCLLDEKDIMNGNRRTLVPFLASLFLHMVPSNELPDKALCSRLSVHALNKFFKHVHGVEHLNRKMTTMTFGTVSGRSPQRLSRNQSTQEAMSPILESFPNQQLHINLDIDSSDEENEEEDGEDVREYAHQIESVFDTLEASSGSLAYDDFSDPGKLLRPGESIASLFEIPVKELLLRWLNLQTDSTRVIKNFGSDLSNGSFLLKVISKTAPEVVAGAGIRDLGQVLGQYCVQAVMECGPRAVEAFNLTPEALQEGREDLIACFVGKMFLVRPNLPPQTGSQIWQHLKTMEKFIRGGYAITDASAEKNYADNFQAFAKDFRNGNRSMDEALSALIDRERVRKEFFNRVQQFVEHNYVQRGTIRRKTTLLGGNNALKATLQNDVLTECVKVSEWRSLLWSDPPETLEDHIRQTIQTHGKVLQVLFNLYALQSPQDRAYRLPLEGLMKIYRSCRLRCPCTHLPPHVAELLYYQILQEDMPPWKKRQSVSQVTYQWEFEGLSAQGFIRWLLRVALHRHDQITLTGVQRSFRETLEELVSRHFKAHAAKDDEFTRINNMPEVRKVFLACEAQLRSVFEFYSDNTEEDIIASSHGEEQDNTSEVQVISETRFSQLFIDGGLMKAQLSRSALSNIVKNIVAGSHSTCGSKPGGLARVTKQFMELSGWVAPERQTIKTVAKQVLENLDYMQHQNDVSQKDDMEKKRMTAARASHIQDHEPEPLFMTFFEFADATLAAALMAHPNPFLNVELRVEWYLTKVLFPSIATHWNETAAVTAKRSEKDRQELVSVLSGNHDAALRNRMQVKRQKSLAIFQTRMTQQKKECSKRAQFQKMSIVGRTRPRPLSASSRSQKGDASESGQTDADLYKVAEETPERTCRLLQRPRSSIALSRESTIW